MPTKTSSEPLKNKPLSRAKAWGCVTMNQLAFPGLGTLLSGRRGIGYVQASIMVAGFCFVLAFFGWMMICAFRVLNNTLNSEELFPEYLHRAWIALAGFGLCAISWCWALISSIEILRTSADPEDPPPSPEP